MKRSCGFVTIAGLGLLLLAVSVKPSWGGGNTSYGNEALGNVTSGSFNSAFGDGALGSITTGSTNTGAGAGVIAQSNDNQNTATGAFALLSSIAGSQNTADGYDYPPSSPFPDSISNYNTLIGAFAL